MSILVISEKIQELLGTSLLTEEQVSAYLDAILRKRPCLVLLVLSHLVRRLLMPNVAVDAYNVALVYAFCLSGAHMGIFQGLSALMRLHTTMVMRIVLRSSAMYFQSEPFSLRGLVENRGALVLLSKALFTTPWLSKADLRILAQAPALVRLRTEQERLKMDEEYTRRTNFVTATDLIARTVEERYLPLQEKYNRLLNATVQQYSLLFDEIQQQDAIDAFRAFLADVQRNNRSSAQRFGQLGARFKWRRRRDRTLSQEDARRERTTPQVIVEMMGRLRSFARSPTASNTRFAERHNRFLHNLLRIAEASMPLERELAELETLIQSIMNNNVRGMGEDLFLAKDTLMQCHDKLVTSGFTRQDLLSSSGTLLFLLGVSQGSVG